MAAPMVQRVFVSCYHLRPWTHFRASHNRIRCISTLETTERSTLQLTLAIVKPDACKHPFALRQIKKMIVDNNFLVVRSKQEQLSRKQAEEFYSAHEGKFFYTRLITYMSSGSIFVHVLARRDAIQHWRRLMGPTKTFRAIHEDPTSIRGLVGLTDTRNATHGSDSPESAMREIHFFFPEFDMCRWYELEEPIFREASVDLDEEKFIHLVRQ